MRHHLFWPCTVLLLVLGMVLGGCAMQGRRPSEPFIVVLGVAQDAGYPQAACRKACCAPAWRDASARRHVACLGIVDPETGQRWLIDATPDVREQLRMLDAIAPVAADNVSQVGLAGILLTHAHIGHYLGLAQLGREVTGARGVAVYAMPRMRAFLEGNGPWDQLVSLGNIELRDLAAGVPVELAPGITVTAMVVPHRDEYAETVGFVIAGPGRRVLYVPDIDKWASWDRRIEDELARVDVAYLDGTFFANGEIPGRDMREIPHPFVEETMGRLGALPASERAKVRFIHFNHTNPLCRGEGAAVRRVGAGGFGVAREGELMPLVRVPSGEVE